MNRPVVALSLFLSACGVGNVETDGAQSARAPRQALSGGGDASDRSCGVVLRGVQRSPDFENGGYKQRCQGEVCAWLWEGQIDVSKDAFAGAPPVGVLYRLSSDATWWEVEANPGATGQPGFWHYTFQVSEHLVGAATRPDELSRVQVQLIPFVRLDGGGRLFDHNRRPGDFDAYTFGEPEYFAVGADASCAAVAGTVAFLESWQQFKSGSLHAGGWLAIDYDLDRLPQCRATHNGTPAWGTTAHVRFSPGGQLASGPVNDFVRVGGVPTSAVVDKRFEVKIPADATSAEVWFQNASGAGNSCETWDSNYGTNYQLEILPAVDDPRCRGVERWSAIYGGAATCLSYAVDAHYAATSCELYVDGFGHGYEGHYGIPVEWLEAWIALGPQQGEVLGAGMFTRYTDQADGKSKERISLGAQVDGKWKTGFTFASAAVMAGGGWRYAVEQVAFFVDVRRPDGSVARLWQSRGGANYGWDDAFGAGTTTQYIPYGNAKWAVDGAGIFDSRRSCR